MNRNVRTYGIWAATGILLGGALFYLNDSFAAPPLVLDDEEEVTLLGGDDVDPEMIKKENAARELNGKCYVCHGNYIEEEFAKKHALGKVGCFDCHGEAVAHRNDENHLTPPDHMFSSSELPDEMVESCQACHETHDVAAKDVLTRYQERKLDKKPLEEVTCMDCHGSHRLDKRTVRWNKRTGEVIPLVEGVDAKADRTNTLDLFKDRQSKNYGLGREEDK
ncbi:MAG: cytochrome c3 family protein [Thermoguttaceae bacterium]|nr:cytochrome c3 family protein [Thermoguttaceae bacterium]